MTYNLAVTAEKWPVFYFVTLDPNPIRANRTSATFDLWIWVKIYIGHFRHFRVSHRLWVKTYVRSNFNIGCFRPFHVSHFLWVITHVRSNFNIGRFRPFHVSHMPLPSKIYTSATFTLWTSAALGYKSSRWYIGRFTPNIGHFTPNIGRFDSTSAALTSATLTQTSAALAQHRPLSTVPLLTDLISNINIESSE